MPVCENHPRNKNSQLCMGCGKYFCSDCGRLVHKVFFCHACETAAEQFAQAKTSSSASMGDPGEEPSKWEQGFSSAVMIVLSRKELDKIKEPLPLGGMLGSVLMRGIAFVADWLAVCPKWFYILSNSGLIRPYDALYMFWGEVIVAFFYFLIFNYGTGMTFGKMLVGLRLVDSLGKQVSIGQAFGRALVSFIAVPLFPIFVPLHLLCSLITSTRKGCHDIIFDTYVVKDEPWRKMAKEAIALGGRVPKKAGVIPKRATPPPPPASVPLDPQTPLPSMPAPAKEKSMWDDDNYERPPVMSMYADSYIEPEEDTASDSETDSESDKSGSDEDSDPRYRLPIGPRSS